MLTESQYQQGYTVRATDDDFAKALEAAVDYRGDTTIETKDGKSFEGYLYNVTNSTLELFPKKEENSLSVPIDNVAVLSFTGKDTASGKSWEAWIKKKKEERDKIKAQKIEEE